MVISGDSQETLTVDQTKPLPPGEHFQTIGEVNLNATVETTITVTTRNTRGFVIVDALQLLPIP